MMDHPNIAKVLDAGTTRQGRPYFVMELVRGIRITQFCDDQQLTPKERLELFIPVCHAIQHAHQKGVIHRDIKPSNILVSLYDGRPVPKVIDFGVAKAIQQRLTDKTMFTQFGQVMGTLEYMSPEQAEMNQLDIDTRADIYSLGAVLYELLTGSPPFEHKRLRSAAFDQVLRIIREEEPPRPSLRLSASENLPTISAQRKMEPARLSRFMRGEIDWIVMKALDKQRSRRYDSASRLAADIEAHLSGLPVSAVAPSTAYRVQKYVRRHKAPLAVAATILAILAATTVFSSVQWLRADHAAEVAFMAEGQAIQDRDEKEIQRLRAVAAEQAAKDQRKRAEQSAQEARSNLYTAHMQQIQLEWDRSNLARIRELLARYATSAPSHEDQRGWEWHYWTRMCEQDLRTFKGHVGPVNAVAFNSNGSLVASAGNDGTVCIWNVGDGKLVRQIKAHEGVAACVAFHGDKVASGGFDRAMRLWDATDGRELGTFQYGNAVACVEFSSDGKLLAVGTATQNVRPVAGRPAERRIIEVETLTELHQLDAEREVAELAFTRDGSQLVVAATPNVEFWNTRTGELLKEVGVDEVLDNDLQFQVTEALALSRTNEFFVTASMDHLVRKRSFSDAKPTTTYRGHTAALTSVALSPNERVIASAGADNAIILWNIETGEEMRRLRGHEKGISCVRFSADGLRLASASNDGTVKIWDAVQPTDLRPFLTGTRGHHMAAAFSRDGRLHAVSHFLGNERRGPNNTFFQWVEVRNALSGRRAFDVDGHHGWINAIAFSHDGSKIATGARDFSVKTYDVATQSELHTLDGFTWSIGGLAFSPEDHWLQVQTVDVDPNTRIGTPTLQVWNVSTGDRAAAFPATASAFHPEEDVIAVASSKDNLHAIDFYRSDRSLSRQPPFRSLKLEEPAWFLRYDRGGKRLAANLDMKHPTPNGLDPRSKLIVWNATDGSKLTSIANAGDFLGFDLDGERVFSRSAPQKVSVWHAQTGDLMCEVTVPHDNVHTSVTISPDGTRIGVRNLRFNHLLELGPTNDEARDQLEARNLAAHLLKFPTQLKPYITKSKAELLRDVSQLATISQDVRRATAELLEDLYTREEEAMQLGSHGLDLIREPGKSRAEYEEGLKWLNAAVEIDREHWECEYGLALYRLERYQEALAAIENSHPAKMKRDPRAPPWVLAARAMAEFRLGMKEKAIATLGRAKAAPWAETPENVKLVREARSVIEPDNRGEEDMAQGTTFARRGQWEKAVAAFARAEKQLAGNLRVRCLHFLAQANLAAGNKEANRRVCEQLATDFNLDTNGFATSRLAYASVVNSDAIDDWTSVIKASEKHGLEGRVRGALMLRAGDYNGALKILPQARVNIRAWDWAFIAMAEFRAGNHDVARDALRRCEQSLSDATSGKMYTEDWHWLLEERLLCEEAKQLIFGTTP
jgi:WD40 repeat protein/tetratricopeptide (TPR) repeat protein